MPPKFRTKVSTASVAEDPERLYDDLPRERGRLGALWGHQTDVLRAYYERHLTTPDVALELPTGAGKTLPGLLIAEWRRRKYPDHRVMYACPTQHLARQTAEAASRAGIDVVTLVGSHRDWPTADKMRYEGARAIAVTTYSTVFNVVPALEPANTLLFDDAHAAEQFVAGSWSVEIGRHDRPDLYRLVLGLLKPTLSGIAYEHLLEGEDPVHRSVHLVSAANVRRVAGPLAAVLRDLGRDDHLYWRGEALGPRLDRCQIFVAWDGILIRPFTPPTAVHRHFTQPDQRIYISATLGEGGELERSFGRTGIVRLPIPKGWESRNAGRRFFVFPNLQTSVPPRELTALVVAEAGKALVLSPSTRRAKAADDLAAEEMPVLGPGGKVDALLNDFRAKPTALLTLANRYDGLDLPDSQCRVTVLDGMPSGAHLQERFVSETLVAGRVLRERLRTRVLQGAGRCTRGLSDHSVVVVLGDQLTRFLGLPEVHNAMRPELQAEVDFGLENSDASPDELMEFVRSFLDQDDAWLEQAEPVILESRNVTKRTSPPENDELAAAASHEVKAGIALWSGDWAAASQAALDAAAALRSRSLKGYRALWTYLAAAWLLEEAEDRNDDGLRRSGNDLLRKAHTAARGTAWLRDVQPLPPGESALDELDEAAVQRAVEHGPRRLAGGRWAALNTEMLAGLSQTSAEPYERALKELGGLLGAESYKPRGAGRTDSAWIWPSAWWLAIEAKSEEKPDSPVSITTVRQANDHLKTLAHDRAEPIPGDSAVLIVSPRQLVDPTAAIVAEPFLHLAPPPALLALAQDAVAAWKQIRSQASGMSDEEAVDLTRRAFVDYSILPSHVRARLLGDPIQG